MGENENKTLQEVFREGVFEGLAAADNGAPEQATNEGQPTTAETQAQSGETENRPDMVQSENAVPTQPETMPPPSVTGNTQPNNSTAPDPQTLLNMLIPMLKAKQEENAQLKQSLQQQSDEQKAELQEQLEPPTLDVDGMMYDDDATRQKKQTEYNNALLEYQRKQIMREIEPMTTAFRAQKQAEEVQSAINGLHNTPGVGGKFDDVAADIPATIRSIPLLAQMPPNEAVPIAALIAKGRMAANAQAKTPDQIADEAFANPEVMKRLEMKRAEQLKANQNVPPMSASQGAFSNAPVNVEPRPDTVKDGLSVLKKMLGGN